MSKTSRTVVIAVLAAAAVAAPILSDSAAARRAPRHHAPSGRLYNYAPGGLYDYAPGPAISPYSPYSNYPAATGGGSLGYNVDNLRDGG